MKKILSICLITFLFIAVGCQTPENKKGSAGKRSSQPIDKPKILGKKIQKKVFAYFANQEKEDAAYKPVEEGKKDPEDPTAYQFAFPVIRIIETTTTTVEEDTVKELLKGPTDGEEEQGYRTEIHNIELDSLTIKNKVATAKFTGKKFYLEGDMSGARVRAQIEKTLLQFPHIKKAVIYINGNPKFDDLSG